jgi:restriction system protein
MAAFYISRRELVGLLKEAAGYKSGLALTKDDLQRVTPHDFAELIADEDEHVIRMRAEDFDDLFARILYGLGASEVKDGTPAQIRMLSKYYATDKYDLFAEVERVWIDFLLREMNLRRQPGSKIDPSEPMTRVLAQHGRRGGEILLEIITEQNSDIQRHFWNRVRRTDWQDARDLQDLFRSERLGSFHGKFFDQRFVDYLHANFSRIDEIHWRQFEGLTCEFFEREGFRVEIGPGRNDGGIDVRIWKDSVDASAPSLILVQCKRQKQKVGKTVVKALYADVLDENARGGLIVTTSGLAPGASEMKTARSYPVDEADRKTLRAWIEAMKTART